MSASSDRNLLFGILALQMDVITREQLLAGMQGWMLAKSRSLGDILVEQQVLPESNQAELEEMVTWHIQMHGADPVQSLAAVSSVESSLNEALASLADPQVEATRVLTGSDDSTARLWDLRTGTPLGEPMQHGDRVASVAFSPDGIRCCPQVEVQTVFTLIGQP